MYTVTFILRGELYSIASPCFATAWTVRQALHYGARVHARMWKHKQHKQLRMIA